MTSTRWPTEEEAEAIRTAFLTNRLHDHEYATAMPPQTPVEFRELRTSIGKRGFDAAQPIVVWKVGRNWMVLDGRHRREAAREVIGYLHMGESSDELAEDLAEAADLDADALTPSWAVFEGTADEALDLVELRNLHGRRNFPTADAKALAAMQLYELRMRDGKRSRPTTTPADATEPTTFALTPPGDEPAAAAVAPDEQRPAKKGGKRIRDEIAEQINVPPRTVARARAVKQHAAAELGDERAREIEQAVAEGKMKLSAAEREIRQSRERREREQRRAELLEQQQQALLDDRLTVLVNDVIEALRGLPDGSVHVAVADGPYNLSHGGTTVESGEIAVLDKGSWDRFADLPSFGRWCREWIAELERVLAPGGQLFLTATRHAHPTLGVMLMGSKVFSVESDIVWRKTNAKPRATPGLQDDHEIIWWAYKGRRRYVETTRTSATWEGPTVGRAEKEFGSHSCQKPAWLIDAMLDLVDAGPEDTVLDLFAGSGTTTERAIKRGCRVIAIDNDPQWKPVIEARAAAVARVPAGTDDETRDDKDGSVDSEDCYALAYVLAAVEGGCTTWGEIVDAVASEAGQDAAEIEKAIRDAIDRGLIADSGGHRLTLTDDGAEAVARIAERLEAHALGAASDPTNERQGIDPERAAMVARAVAQHFGWIEPSMDADQAECMLDGLICGLDGEASEDVGGDWGDAYQVGAWLREASDVAALLGLGLAQGYVPTMDDEMMRQHWNDRASQVGRAELELPESTDERGGVWLGLAFVAGFLSRWVDFPPVDGVEIYAEGQRIASQIRLAPADHDGEPIKVGDRVEIVSTSGEGTGRTGKVSVVRPKPYARGGGWPIEVLPDADDVINCLCGHQVRLLTPTREQELLQAQESERRAKAKKANEPKPKKSGKKTGKKTGKKRTGKKAPPKQPDGEARA